MKWVIHTVGPRYRGTEGAATLASAYTAALARADEVGTLTVAFPSISTGSYRYPSEEAQTISARTLRNATTAVERVLLVASSERMARLWKNALDVAHLA